MEQTKTKHVQTLARGAGFAAAAMLVAIGFASACGKGGGGADAGTGMDSGTGQALSDNQILEIAETANTGEVGLGQLAAPKATTPSTVEFANRMVQDHSAANARLQGIATSTGISPAPSTTSEHLQAQAQQVTNTLNSTPQGLDFDIAYVQSQVTMHQQVLALLNDRLIPQAKNTELKTELQLEAAAVQQHLTVAQQTLTNLEAMRPDGGAEQPDAGAMPDAGAEMPDGGEADAGTTLP